MDEFSQRFNRELRRKAYGEPVNAPGAGDEPTTDEPRAGKLHGPTIEPDHDADDPSAGLRAALRRKLHGG